MKRFGVVALVCNVLWGCGGGGGSGGSSGATATPVSVSPTPSPAVAVKLNDTGVTGMGYDSNGNYVANCTSAAAGNDCNTGRDVTANDDADGHAGFSFTKIAADGSVLPTSAMTWSCVKDNVTGLLWENKTSENGGMQYTNYDDTTQPQAVVYINNNYANPSYVNPTQGQIDSPTNSVGYKNAVNNDGLCGVKNWRIPSIEELQSIADYSFQNGIDLNWFPNTRIPALPTMAFYLTSSAYLGEGNHTKTFGIEMSDGKIIFGLSRQTGAHIRLVSGE